MIRLNFLLASVEIKHDLAKLQREKKLQRESSDILQRKTIGTYPLNKNCLRKLNLTDI
jgi:hypothetical protein